MNSQHLIQHSLLWLIHLERVAAFVLVAIGSAAFAARILLLRRRSMGIESGSRAWVAGFRGATAGVLSVGVALMAASLAVRPDVFFLTQMGRDAVARKDAVDIINYYEPLVGRDSVGLDVYENLALAYLSRGRPRDAIAVLHVALATTPAAEDHLICASVHLALGENAEARAHADTARTLAYTPEQRAAVERLAAAVPGSAAPAR